MTQTVIIIYSPETMEIRSLHEPPVQLEVLRYEMSQEPKPLILRSNLLYIEDEKTILVYWPREWPLTLGMVTLYTWMTRQKVGVTYSINELQRLLAIAKQLGFQDDIDHWSGLLREQGVQA